MKVLAKLAYDGSYFAGFARQKSAHNSVVSELEKALHSLKIDSPVLGAGRTDKGVHAFGQAISFIVPNYWSDLEKLQNALNKRLKPKMQIYTLVRVNDNFEVRFDAKKRTYIYLIRLKPYSPFWANYAWHTSCDYKKAADAISAFKGTHDFSGFCKTDSTRELSPIKHMINVRVCKWKDGIAFIFSANGFLRSQVRLMSAFLVEIASDRLSIDELKLQLQNKQKILTKPAPPQGLYLSKVTYDVF